MLKIRLQRAGRRNLPHYRVVLAEASAPVKGKFIKKLGYYNPIAKNVGLDKEAILSWLAKGAKPSNTMSRLLLKEGVKHKQIEYIKKKPKETKKKAQAAQTAQIEQKQKPAPVEEQPKQEKVKEENK